jgi:hypothetical protein
MRRHNDRTRPSLLTRVARHLRLNVVGYLALVVALSVTPAVASHLNVKTSDIQNGAVTTPKLRNGAVKPAKINRGAVTRPKIRNNAINTPKLANNAVQAAKIADGAVETSKIADGAVTKQKLSEDFLHGPVRRVEAISPNTSGVGQFRNVTAACPAGERAIAGGAMWTMLDGSPTGFNILQGSRPVPFAPGIGVTTGWQATGITDNAAARQLRAYAICVPL